MLAGRIAGGDLDASRLDAGLADAVVDLVQVELGDLLRRSRTPVVRNADVLEVEARRAHDLHPRLAGHLGEQLGIAAEVDRTRVDEGAHAVPGQPAPSPPGGGDRAAP